MLLRASVEEHFAFLIPVQLAGTKHLQIIVLRMRDVHQTTREGYPVAMFLNVPALPSSHYTTNGRRGLGRRTPRATR